MTDHGFETAPIASPSRRGRWVILGVALCTAGVGFLTLWSGDGQRAAPRLIGNAWVARANDGPRLYFVMEEERWQRRFPNYARRQYWFTVDYSVFSLHARDAHTGESARTAELARIDFVVQGQGPVILGPQGGVLWLWNGGLEARDLNTLAPVWTASRLLELNPEFAATFPNDRKYFKVLGKLKALVIKGQDARYLQVDSDSGKFQALPDAALARLYHSNKADDAFNYLYPGSDSFWSTSTSGLMWDSLTADGVWYALLTADERANLPTRPGNGKSPSGEAARSLFRGNYELEDRPLLQSREILLDLASVAPANDHRFLMAGFLRRPHAGNVWPVDGGKSFLVLHRKVLGDNSPWHITRLGLDGTIHWTTSTGLAELQHLCDTHGTVVFTGFADTSQPTRRRPDLVVFIDELTGQIRTLNLVSNEFAAG